MKNEMRNSFALLLFFSCDHVTQEYGARRSAERTAIDSLNASTLIAELTRVNCRSVHSSCDGNAALKWIAN
jgi:hypothetical protein